MKSREVGIGKFLGNEKVGKSGSRDGEIGANCVTNSNNTCKIHNKVVNSIMLFTDCSLSFAQRCFQV